MVGISYLIALVGQQLSQDSNVKAYYYTIDHTHLKSTVYTPDASALYCLIETACDQYLGKLY